MTETEVGQRFICSLVTHLDVYLLLRFLFRAEDIGRVYVLQIAFSHSEVYPFPLHMCLWRMGSPYSDKVQTKYWYSPLSFGVFCVLFPISLLTPRSWRYVHSSFCISFNFRDCVSFSAQIRDQKLIQLVQLLLLKSRPGVQQWHNSWNWGDCTCVSGFTDPSSLFHWSACLFLCSTGTTFITIVSLLALLSGCKSPAFGGLVCYLDFIIHI